jgi:hypothetical protein
MLSSIGNWLLKTDPTYVFIAVTAVGGWLWRQVSGDTKARFDKVINAVIDNLLLTLIDSIPDPAKSVPLPQYLRNARQWMEDTVWKALARRGVPKTAATIAIVHAAIERASKELGDRVLERRRELAAAGGP